VNCKQMTSKPYALPLSAPCTCVSALRVSYFAPVATFLLVLLSFSHLMLILFFLLDLSLSALPSGARTTPGAGPRFSHSTKLLFSVLENPLFCRSAVEQLFLNFISKRLSATGGITW
jgi:hypothetical protein